jgi:glycine betaine/proline transport system substrate-binding protein
MRALLAGAGTACALLLAGLPAAASEPDQCRLVRMSDLGWTDIALTNTTAQVVLETLGYEVEQTLLGLDVTYLMLKESQLDVFQGNWRPVQDEQFASYFDEGSVEVLGTNLTGAKFTLAVPAYVADEGVRSFADLDRFADRFGSRIYAIEPGSNQPLLDMVEADRHGLGGWEIVESSEAAMLSQVRRSIPREDWIVFLGWEPHPMNLDIDMEYLAGGDVEFGPDFGGATVRTISRPGYAEECPNVARFFSNLVFDLDYENRGMSLITNEERSPAEAARAMIGEKPDRLDAWLDGVTTFDGEPALAAARAGLDLE